VALRELIQCKALRLLRTSAAGARAAATYGMDQANLVGRALLLGGAGSHCSPSGRKRPVKGDAALRTILCCVRTNYLEALPPGDC
jgi:hypothetical protein